MDKIFQKIKKDWKLQIITFFVLMCIMLVPYPTIKYQIERLFTIVSDDYSWVYQVDEIREESSQLIISGFAFLLGEDSKYNNCEIILCNTRTGKGYYPKMSFSSREDVNLYFLCEYDYTQSGFMATIDLKKLDLRNETYEILLRQVGKKEAYSTGIYYKDGKMMFVNPENFVPLETVGTDLEKITADGVLRVYRPDVGMYIYQYEDELYWIAEPYYGFVEADTYIEFQMDTTQIEKLPEHRIANNWLWSNIGFRFKSKELVEWDTGKYRVAKCALPIEHSVTTIWTGKYVEKWIWNQFFRPWYVFSR